MICPVPGSETAKGWPDRRFKAECSAEECGTNGGSMTVRNRFFVFFAYLRRFVMFITLKEATNKGFSEEKLINLIKRDQINGVLIEKGCVVVDGFVDDKELNFVDK